MKRAMPLFVATLLGSAVDQPTGTVVVTNMNDNTATVIDIGANRVLATLPTGEGPHEVAVSHSGKWAVVSNYGVRGKPGSTLTVLDLDRVRVDRTISLGTYRRPHGTLFLPGDTLLAISAEANQAVLLVDMRVDSVVGTIPTMGRASHMVTAPGNGAKLYTSNIADGTVSELDVGTRKFVRNFPVGRSNEGIAITPDGSAVWSGSNGDSTIVVVDTKSARSIDTLRGFGMPYRLAITRDGSRVVVTDPAKSEVKILDARTRRPLATVTIARDSVVATSEFPGSASPEGVVTSSDSRWAFVTLQGRNRMITIDLRSAKIVSWTVTGVWSDGIAYSPLVEHHQ